MIFGFGNTDAAAQVGRLHEHRIGERPFQFGDDDVGLLFPLAAQEAAVLCLRDAGLGEKLFAGHFVHACCAGEDAAAYVGQPCHFEQTLHRAVFAERTVQHGEDQIDGRQSVFAGEERRGQV